jgi:hypothetical protein
MTESNHDPQTSSDADDALLAALTDALQAVDPVPDHVVAAASAAFSWRTVDAELAELSFDSAEQPLGVRGVDVNRQLTFRSTDLEIELMVTAAESRRLVGQLVPPDVAEIELVSAGSERSVSSDHLGRFAFDGLVDGPARLVVRSTGPATAVQTEWMLF